MKNNLYYPKVSLSDEDIFLEIKENLETEYQKYQKEKIGVRNVPIRNKK